MGNKFILRSMFLPIISLRGKNREKYLIHKYTYITCYILTQLVCKGENSQDFTLFILYIIIL